MKTKIRIIWLVILAMLVTSVIAVTSVSSAEPSGVTLKTSETFDGADVGLLGTASDGKNPRVGNFVFQQGGRTGTVKIVSSEPYESNKYAVIIQDDKVGTQGPYAYSVTGDRPTTTTLKCSTDMSNYSYYAFDIDVMSPTGKFINGANVDFSSRYVNSAGTVTFWNNTAINNIIKLGNDSAGSYIYLNGAESNKKYVDPYDFTHITCILETKVTSSAYSVNAHLYVNGTYFASKTGSTSTTSYYKSTPHASLVEYRINYLSTEDTTQTLAIDNVNFRLFSKDYNGNLATVLSSKTTLDAWESNLYDASSMPTGFFEALNVNKNAIYMSLAEAVSAASAGDTIKVTCDHPEEITVNKNLIIDASNGSDVFSVNIVAADGYVLVPAVGGKYYIESEDKTVYEYVSGGTTCTAGVGTAFGTVISAADAGSTVKIVANTTINVASSTTLNKNLTLDLCGNTVAFIPAQKINVISIGSSKTLTVKNGTLISEYADAGYAKSSYPVFGMQTKAKLIVENLNTFTPCLVWNYGSNNVTVTVNGGEHHIDRATRDVTGGFFESRSNATFTATDAVFYCGQGGGGLFSSLHYKADSLATRKSTYTFNNCKLLAETPQTKLIKVANEFTYVNFNNCDVFGSLNPSVAEFDKTQPATPYGPMKENSIVIGEGCRLINGATYSDAVCIATGYSLSNADYSETRTFDIASGSFTDGNYAIGKKTQTYNYKYLAESVDYHTVTWYKADGVTVIKTERLTPGSIATPPANTESGSNGWFVTTYSGWANKLGGQEVTDFTVNRDASYYPAISGTDITPSLKASQYNLSLLGAIQVNFYLPVTPDGIELIGVYDKDGAELFPKTVYTKGVEYNMYVAGEVGATSLTDKKDVTVKFTVGETTLSQTVSLSPYNYAETVIADSNNQKCLYHPTAHTLVADMVRYSVMLSDYVEYTGGEGAAAELRTLYESAKTLCSPLPSNFSDVSEVNKSAISGYINSVTFEVSKFRPAYLLTFPKSAGVIDAYITLDGYYSDVLNGANFGNVTYKATTKSYHSGSELLSSVYIGNIPMYNVDSTVTINLLLESGITKSGTYNINGYYNDVYGTTGDVDKEALIFDFLKSLRAFSEAAVDYRYATIVVDEESAVDFRKCDHASKSAVTVYIGNSIIPLEYKAHYCSDCDSYLVYYSDYGVMGDGVTNDFSAIRSAHIAANDIVDSYPSYNVVVISGEGTFYIGDPDDGGASAIGVHTNVDWDGAHFIIDDVQIDLDGGERASAKQSIFLLEGDADSVRGVSITNKIPGGVAMGATNIGYAPGKKMMIHLHNKAVRHYIRYGGNVNSGAVQAEVIIVDEYGNIDPTTPVQWDYTSELYCSHEVISVNSSSNALIKCTPVDTNFDGKCDTCAKTIGQSFYAEAYSADDDPIIVSGLDKDGNINCIWETRTSTNVSLASYNQIARNINIARSNTIVEGIDRVFVEDNTNSTPRQTYAAYVNVSLAYNTIIRDMLVCQHLSHYDTSGNLLGSYELGGGNSIGTSWINCRIKNFFNSNGTVTYRGMFGTNYMRNSYLKDCVLTSFDSHSGAYNVTIEDSTFEHINFVGGGEAIMRNVTVYADGGYASCILRSDYGSMWQGNLKIDGLTLRHAASYSRAYVDIVRAHYTNHYFGYTTYNPIKIYANNVKIEQYTRSSATYDMVGGTIVEPNVTKSTKKLGILQILNSELKNSTYDYSTINANNLNPKICTEAVYITNSNVTIAYPTHKYFKDMKVYIDGVEQNWY